MVRITVKYMDGNKVKELTLNDEKGKKPSYLPLNGALKVWQGERTYIFPFHTLVSFEMTANRG